MFAQPLISAIIVTFNQMEYLYETIDSVLCQDYPYIELIIADDCSSGFEINTIKQYIEKNNRGNIQNLIIFSNQTNLGTVRNVNKAISIAAGDYIKLIGGDDAFFDETVFKKQIDYLKNTRKLIVIGKAQQCDCNLVPIYDPRIERANELLESILRMEYKEARRVIRKNDIFPIVTQTICFSRRFFELYGLCDERYTLLDDAPTANKILRNNLDVGYLDLLCVKHRASVGISATSEMFSPKRIKYYEDCVNYVKYELLPFPEVEGKLYPMMSLKIEQFRYDMCLCIIQEANKKEKFRLFLHNLDALIYYIIFNPQKTFMKIVWLVRNRILKFKRLLSARKAS